jgi:hypothetical protein
MDVNKFQILRQGGVSKQVNIPIELTWDYNGLDDAIDEYEVKIIEEVIGKGRDFEVSRFSHAPHNSPSIYINTTTGQIGNGNSQSIPGQSEATFANYEFYFYSGGSINNLNNWQINYLGEGFSPQDLYYYSNSFTNSFFKLDLYDTPDEKRQTNYVTLIIPTQQGLKMEAQMQRNLVSVHKPEFVLDFNGDKEGFFIYWLKKRNFLNISTFYMSAKFYNARTGQFTKMMTGRGWDPSSSTPPCQQQWPSYLTIDKTLGPQACMSAGERFTFDNTQYFYYTVQLDYPTQTYQIYNTFGQRVGTNIPIKWYEYINP